MTATARRRKRPDYPLELLWNLTLRELRGKYKRSILGWGWSLLNPLVQLAVYSAVFGILFKATPPPGDPSGIHAYSFWLVSGLLAWNFHLNGVMGAIGSLAGNGNLIRKVYFPRSILPFATSLSWLVSFAIEIAALIVILAVFQTINLAVLPLVVVAAALLMLFSLGLGLLVSAVNVYFRDIEYLTQIALQVWFFGTPIVYNEKLLTNPKTGLHYHLLGIDVLTIEKLNPMYHFTGLFRTLLYHQTWPTFGEIGVLVAFTAASLAVGSFVFRRIEPRMAEEL